MEHKYDIVGTMKGREVMLELSKGNMIYDIVALLNSGVITIADLEGFSDELKESMANFTNR